MARKLSVLFYTLPFIATECTAEIRAGRSVASTLRVAVRFARDVFAQS